MRIVVIDTTSDRASARVLMGDISKLSSGHFELRNLEPVHFFAHEGMGLIFGTTEFPVLVLEGGTTKWNGEWDWNNGPWKKELTLISGWYRCRVAVIEGEKLAEPSPAFFCDTLAGVTVESVEHEDDLSSYSFSDHLVIKDREDDKFCRRILVQRKSGPSCFLGIPNSAYKSTLDDHPPSLLLTSGLTPMDKRW